MCSCDMGDPPAFFSQTYVKARKPHRCCECPFQIDAGEIYVRSVGKWDGELDSFKRHVACDEAGHVERGCVSAFTLVLEDLRDCDVERGHPARRAWGRHLWRFRRHPKARDLRLRMVLDDCDFGGEP